MFECPNCKKNFRSKPSFSSHWGLICKPGARGNVSGYLHPKFGKAGKNGYTDKNWNLISFDNLSLGQKRKRLLEESNYSCTSCGFSKNRECGRSILEIDHIDGDHTNNTKENLRVLCPNCHALTPNFRNWNRKGNKKSSKRFRKGNAGYTEAMIKLREMKAQFEEDFKKEVLRLHESGEIDFSKYGWVQILAEKIDEQPQVVGRRVRKLLPDFFVEHCFSRAYTKCRRNKNGVDPAR